MKGAPPAAVPGSVVVFCRPERGEAAEESAAKSAESGGKSAALFLTPLKPGEGGDGLEEVTGARAPAVGEEGDDDEVVGSLGSGEFDELWSPDLVSFLAFILRFWNQILICLSVSPKL